MGSVAGQTLEVTLIGAQGLKNNELFTKQDPYVVLQYAGQVLRTKTDIDGGTNPAWNSVFNLRLQDGLYEFQAVIWNENVARDDIIGSSRINFQNVLQSGMLDTWHPVYDSRQRPRGSIHVLLKYHAAMYRQQQPHAAPSPYPAYPPAPAPSPYGAAPYGAPPPAHSHAPVAGAAAAGAAMGVAAAHHHHPPPAYPPAPAPAPYAHPPPSYHAPPPAYPPPSYHYPAPAPYYPPAPPPPAYYPPPAPTVIYTHGHHGHHGHHHHRHHYHHKRKGFGFFGKRKGFFGKRKGFFK